MIPNTLGEFNDEISHLLHKHAGYTPWVVSHILEANVFPLLLFLYSYYMIDSTLRLYNPNTVIWLCPILVTVFLVILTIVVVRKFRKGRRSRGLVVLTICLWAAFALGMGLGDRNYQFHMLKYYSFMDMASYTDVDPNLDRGQTYMDAGQIYFKENSHVAIDKAIALKSGGVYCVAPIVRHAVEEGTQTNSTELRSPESDTFDFWAVGKDCCDPAGSNFKCASDVNARAGLRLLDEVERPFYLMAVQEWSAWTGLPVKHPLFFLWVQDPLEDADKYHIDANKHFTFEIFFFVLFNLLFVLLALWFLFKIHVP